jgi:uncharacterized membrane protein
MRAAMISAARRIFTAIAVLAVAGIAISSVSLYHHYGSDKSTYCDFGQTFNCDVVNRSVYSVVMGIPVALIGVLGYLALLALATVYRNRRETRAILLAASLAGLGFALYLTYIEKFVLATWCVLCLSSLGVIAAIAALAIALAVQNRRRTVPSG